MPRSGSVACMATFWNTAIALALAALFLGGFALFWIARQDDSSAGRLIGLLAMASAALTTAYLSAGHHWL
jgi:hypothetical protein